MDTETGIEMSEQEIRTLLNQLLKDMFYRILRLQEKSVSKSANDNLSRTEMHTLENIQDSPGATLTQIAEMLGVTKATVSVSVSRLVKKGYIIKQKVDKDKRKSVLLLTEKGEACCKKHKQFHDMLIESILGEFNIAAYPELIKSMEALLLFFNRIHV
jgi:DNA-binding MarR family transcriptional regulator